MASSNMRTLDIKKSHEIAQARRFSTHRTYEIFRSWSKNGPLVPSAVPAAVRYSVSERLPADRSKLCDDHE